MENNKKNDAGVNTISSGNSGEVNEIDFTNALSMAGNRLDYLSDFKIEMQDRRDRMRSQSNNFERPPSV